MNIKWSKQIRYCQVAFRIFGFLWLVFAFFVVGNVIACWYFKTLTHYMAMNGVIMILVSIICSLVCHLIWTAKVKNEN